MTREDRLRAAIGWHADGFDTEAHLRGVLSLLDGDGRNDYVGIIDEIDARNRQTRHWARRRTVTPVAQPRRQRRPRRHGVFVRCPGCDGMGYLPDAGGCPVCAGYGAVPAVKEAA